MSDCWRAWPALASRCALASQVCRLMQRGPEVPESARGHRPPRPSPCQSFGWLGKRRLPCRPVPRGRGTRRLAGCGGRLRLLALPDLRIRSFSAQGGGPATLRAVGSEALPAFQGIFPGPWPRLPAWLFGQRCSGCGSPSGQKGRLELTPVGWDVPIGYRQGGVGGMHRHVSSRDPWKKPSH